MDSVGIVVSTFGDIEKWGNLAKERAVPSAHAQTVPVQVVWNHHESSLMEARNVGASELNTDWLVFLDADDELEPDYVEQMLKVPGDVKQPATRGIHADGRVEDPWVIPYRNLLTGNYIVIGGMVRSDLFWKVGGFRDLPIYEDWDLWLRLEEIGAEFSVAEKAIYRVHVNEESRNNQSPEIQRKYFDSIRSEALARRRKK